MLLALLLPSLLGARANQAFAGDEFAAPVDGWSSVVAARLAANERAVRVTDMGFVATVAGGTARFDASGAEVEAGEAAVALRFAGWGRGDALQSGGDEPTLGACAGGEEVDPRGDCVRRLEIDRGGMTEWWAGRADGLWQGWDLHDRPAGSGPVRIEVEVVGAEAEAGGDGVLLYDDLDRVWRYGGLAAWDADGDELPVEVTVEGDRVVIAVDDRGATWPIVVDPVLTAPTTRLTEPGGGSLGWSLDGAGDVNGDGYDDVILGAPNVTFAAVVEGAAFVYHGSPTGLDLVAATTIRGEAAYAYLGYSVAGAGDVDGDGYDDVIVGVYGEESAYVFHGSASGVSTTPAAELSGLGDDYFGCAVDGAGDVNGDGYADVIVGASGDDTGGGSAGRAYVFQGSATGVSSSYSRAIAGPNQSARLGSSVAGAGDVNGDGYDDILLGAPGGGPAYLGMAYVHLGSAAGVQAYSSWSTSGDVTHWYLGSDVSAAGDVDGDGYDDVLVNVTNSVAEVRLHLGGPTGPSAAADTTLTVGTAADGAGDVNGDGYDDVIVGTYWTVEIYEGGAAGLDATAETELTGASGNWGAPVAGVGDVDADGFADVAVAALADEGWDGSVSIYHGYAQDDDGDGLGADVDCDDADATVGAGTRMYADADGDGYGDAATGDALCEAATGWIADASDCDDADATVHPGATEVWYDGADQDCDGADDDQDGDGHALAEDCDDTDAAVGPVGDEVCNGVDDDCDGMVDERLTVTLYTDADGDGYGDAPVEGCAEGQGVVDDATDCDDADATAHPGAADVADDGIDQDCDGADAADLSHDDGDDCVACKTGGCGCTAPGLPATGFAAVAMAAVLGRRRRTHTPEVP